MKIIKTKEKKMLTIDNEMCDCPMPSRMLSFVRQYTDKPFFDDLYRVTRNNGLNCIDVLYRSRIDDDIIPIINNFARINTHYIHTCA